VKNTSLRLFTWTAVLYAALAMPLLQQLLPSLPIPAPAFLQNVFLDHPNADKSAPSKLRLRGRFLEDQKEVVSTQPRSAPGSPKPSTAYTAAGPKIAPARAMTTAQTLPVLSSIEWTVVATAIYLSVALVFLARFFVGLAFGRRLLRASQRIDDSFLVKRLVLHAKATGVTFILRAAESEFISVPITLGVLHPTILLPATWREWDDAKLDAVFAHEVSHVARRDALTQRLSLFHRAIFWFSPLAWWLDRHLSDLAEQASDEAALSSGADRKHYAGTLLEFFEALHVAPGRVWWQGVAMAKAGQAEKRLERILSWKGAVTMGMKKSFSVVILTLALPAIYLAASAHPGNHGAPAQSRELAQNQTPASTAPAAAPNPQSAPAIAPAAVRGTVEGNISGAPYSAYAPAMGVVAPLMPVAPLAPVPPVAGRAQSETSASSAGHGFSYHYGFDDEQRFVIVSGKTDSLTMSGSSEDARHVEKLRKNIPGDFIWFQRDEKSYVIRDQATIDRARTLWEPQGELGKKQEELGKQQEALGKQQEELGARMEKIRVNIPDMTAELEKLKAELKQLSSGATMDQVGHIQSEIGDLQSKIGDIQSHAGDQQGKLGEEMGALGEKQGKLGEEQGKLGEQQAKLAEQASRDMKQLLDEAIAKGLAHPEI
jgi:beta-lactamase regulating signal transducer with metallopeptidase domain